MGSDYLVRHELPVMFTRAKSSFLYDLSIRRASRGPDALFSRYCRAYLLMLHSCSC